MEISRESKNLKAELEHKKVQLQTLNNDYAELKNTNDSLRSNINNLETKIAADRGHIHQLTCKIDESEKKRKDELFDIELKNSAYQLEIKELTQKIRTLEKSKDEMKTPPKNRRGRKATSPFKTMRDTGLCQIDDIRDTRDIAVGPSTPFIETPKKNLTSDKNTMTDNFNYTRDDVYPLYCGKCKELLDKPMEIIINEMTNLPLPLSPLPATPRRRKLIPRTPAIVQNDKGVSARLENIEQTLGELLEKTNNQTKQQNMEHVIPHYNYAPPSRCCGHNNLTHEHNTPQVDVITALVSKLMEMNDKKSSKRPRVVEKVRKRRLKRVKTRVKKIKLPEKSWEVESETTTINDRDSAIDLYPPTPLLDPPLQLPSQDIFDHRDLFSEPQHEIISNSRLSEEFPEQQMDEHASQCHTDETNASAESSNCVSPTLPVKQTGISKRKRGGDGQKTGGRMNLFKKIRKLKTNQTAVVPIKPLKPDDNLPIKPNEPAPGQKKRIAHVRKSVPDETRIFAQSDILPHEAQDIPVNKIKPDESEEVPLNKIIHKEIQEVSEINSDNNSRMQRGRVTRSMGKSHSTVATVSAAIQVISPRSIIERRKKKQNAPTIVITDCNAINDNHKIQEIPSVQVPLPIEDKHEGPLKQEVGKNQIINESIPHFTTSNDNLIDVDTKNNCEAIKTHEIITEATEMLLQEPLVVPIAELDNPPEIMEIEPEDENIPVTLASPEEPSPASPDAYEPTLDLTPVADVPVASIYDSVMIEEPINNIEPCTLSSPYNEPLESCNSPSNTNDVNCVRELRNRKVQISPTASIAINTKLSSNVIPVKNINFESNQSIESFLERHLALKTKTTKKKNVKYHQEAAIKLCKDAQETVANDLKSLINSPNWDKIIHDNVVDNLTKIPSERLLARCVVNLIIELSKNNEPTDNTYTPPAPILTKSQQRIISLLVSLDKFKPNVIIEIFNVISYHLMRPNFFPELEEAEALSRIFVSLARLKKDRERVRIFICDALYSLQRKALIVIHAVISNWCEVLPMYDENQLLYLPMCIVHVIRAHKYVPNESPKIGQLKRLLKGLYNYPEDQPLSKTHIKKLLAGLVNDKPDQSIMTAIILIAKKEGCEWTYKNIINGGLLKIIIDNKDNSCIYDALRLLGFLLRVFPIADEDGSVRKTVEQLSAILDQGSASNDVEEGVVSALISLARQRFEDVAQSVLAWKPKRNLSSKLQQQLTSFFNTKPPTVWYKLKQKH